jgi:hypothetical protein
LHDEDVSTISTHYKIKKEPNKRKIQNPHHHRSTHPIPSHPSHTTITTITTTTTHYPATEIATSIFIPFLSFAASSIFFFFVLVFFLFWIWVSWWLLWVC